MNVCHEENLAFFHGNHTKAICNIIPLLGFRSIELGPLVLNLDYLVRAFVAPFSVTWYLDL